MFCSRFGIPFVTSPIKCLVSGLEVYSFTVKGKANRVKKRKINIKIIFKA